MKARVFSSLKLVFRGSATTCLVCIPIISGCSSFTDVDAPDVVEFGDLANPEGASALFAGAVTLFAGAYNGNLRGVVGASGALTDELSSGSASLLLLDALDVRDITESSLELDIPLAALSEARLSALSAQAVIRQVAPLPDSRIGELYALAGYTEVLLGEMWCPGVSLTAVEEGRPVAHGPPLPTVEMFQQALADFDSAATHSSDSESALNIARIGRARALLNLGRFEVAAETVAQVPTDFVHATEHSATVQPNGLHRLFTERYATVASTEGENGLAFRTAGDPRVQTQFVGEGNDQQTDIYGWAPVLAAGLAAPTILASGVEARLIEAEAALQAGDGSWLTILNGLRQFAITPGLFPLADPVEYDERVDLLFQERAFWLFLTGRRLGDLRRLIRQYGRSPASVFPTGTDDRGRVYGDAVSIPMPQVQESRNPNFVGCLAHDA